MLTEKKLLLNCRLQLPFYSSNAGEYDSTLVLKGWSVLTTSTDPYIKSLKHQWQFRATWRLSQFTEQDVFSWLGIWLPGHMVHINCERGYQPSGHKTYLCGHIECILIVLLGMKWNESGFGPLLCTYRFNWARRTWWGEWDDTSLQTQDSKFKPWRSEAEHATSRSPRLPNPHPLYKWMGKKHFCFFQTGKRTPNSSVKGSGANHHPRVPALFYSNDTDSLAYFNSFIFSYRSFSSLSLYIIWSTITYTVFLRFSAAVTFSMSDVRHMLKKITGCS